MLTGSTTLLGKDGMYHLKTGIKESELEKAVIQHAEAVFGERAFYFPLKHEVESATKQRATDGLLLDLSSTDSPRFWLVEVELSTHAISPPRNICPNCFASEFDWIELDGEGKLLIPDPTLSDGAALTLD